MQLNIKRLTPALVNDYLTFFDHETHSDGIPEHKCYCVCWSSDDHRGRLGRMSTAEKRRTLAKTYVLNGSIQGYLAYDNDRVVGWCNANRRSDCMRCVSWDRLLSDIHTDTRTDSKAIKSVFCLTVASDKRRQGIATTLLQHVVSDASDEGYTLVEAYPSKIHKTMDDYEGYLDMYLREGFVITEEHERYYVVQKKRSE